MLSESDRNVTGLLRICYGNVTGKLEKIVYKKTGDSLPVASAPPLPLKPMTGTKAVDTVEIPVADTPPPPPPPPPPTALPKPTVYPKPHVPTAVAIATATVGHVYVKTAGPIQTTKPPPPIPPKPISIPAGLVFSHKPGESVKPPPPHVALKAATLPRTKEPPNALSLSLTRPVESKLGATSPKSPLSPRHAKCLQTYVVITLPSEPGSPTEVITVQAPARRGSVPSAKVSGVRPTPLEQKAPTEVFSAQATVRTASVPLVRHPPPVPVPLTVAVEQVTYSAAVAEVQTRRDSLPPVVQPPPSVAEVIMVSSCPDTTIQVHAVPPPIKKAYVQKEQSTVQPLSPPGIISELISMPPKVLIQPLTIQAMARPQSIPSVAHQQHMPIEVTSALPGVSNQGLVPHVPISTLPVQPQPLKEVVIVPLQPIDPLVPQNRSATVTSTFNYPKIATQIEMLQKEQNVPPNLSEGAIISVITEVGEQLPVHEQLTEVEIITRPADRPDGHTIAELSSIPQSFLPLHVEIEQHPHVETLPTQFESPTEVISINAAERGPSSASTVPQFQLVTADVTPIPEVAKSMLLATIDKVIIPTVTEITQSPLVTKVQQMVVQPEVPHVPYLPQVYKAISSSVISHSTPPLEVIALQPEHETPIEIITQSASDVASVPLSMPVGIVKTEETTSKRRTSVSSIVQPVYTTSEIFSHPVEYDIPTQVVTTEAFAATRRESITMQQPLLSAQVINMPAEKDIPMEAYGIHVPYRRESISSAEQQPHVITYPSELEQPLEIIATEAYARRTSIPTAQDIPQGVSVAPVSVTKIQQESIESQEIRGPEKVVSSLSHMYSSSVSTLGQPPESLPSLVTQVVTTEVQRTTVSVVHERLPQAPSSIAITMQPDVAKVQPPPKKNGKMIYPGDVIDLRTMKVGVRMTEQGMDLTQPDSRRQSFSSDCSGRQITAVQPEIVNLSSQITPATTLSVVTDSITIVTCTATIASYNKAAAEKPLDIQGNVMALPLPVKSCKPFEPIAQIVYKPVNSETVVSAVATTAQEIPINLSFGALVSPAIKQPAAVSNEGPVLSLEAMDLSNYRPVRAMVALSSTSPGVVTTVVEDDGTPVDLTAGRRSVCCDVIYKLPFTGSCRRQPPVTTQLDNHFGDRDDHYQYDKAGIYRIKGMNGVKASMSESNLTDAGLFSSDPNSDYAYLIGTSDGAIDLTATKLPSGEYGVIPAFLQV